MIKRIIASFAAVAVIFAADATSSKAQTAGVSTLEQVGHQLKHSYAFSMNRDGSILTLRDLAASSNVVTVTSVSHNDVVFQTVLGDLSSFSKDRQETLRGVISFMNTSLPIGTITVEPAGKVALEHHLNPVYVSTKGMTDLVTRFSKEAARRRTLIFS